MRKIELIYDPDCPNVEPARTRLREALALMNQKAQWTEWDRSASESPDYSRCFGSPTILVDGRDVAGEEPGDGSNSCRVYAGSDGCLEGVPSVEAISKALKTRTKNQRNHR